MSNQDYNSVAIGNTAGCLTQGSGSIAIGFYAGFSSQGNNAIAIGTLSGSTNQIASSIIVNASAGVLNAAYAGTFVAPIRIANSTGFTSTTLRTMFYDTTSNELGYSSTTSASSKSFIINHPDDKERYLVHACLEGPESGVYYRGRDFVEKSLIIKLPDYTKKLAQNFTVHLTPICVFAELYCSEVIDGSFTVYSNKPCKFNWIVYGRRQEIEVEPLKENTHIAGDGPYKWVC